MASCVITLQNLLDKKLVRVDYGGENVRWNQTPPAQVEARSSSSNFQVTYQGDADFHLRYKIEGAQSDFTASAVMEEERLTPAGAAPGGFIVRFNLAGKFPAFTPLYTFDRE
jgi:hypothetical protein